MDLGNLLIIIMLCSYTIFFINLANSKNRKGIKDVNAELTKLRTIKFKTIEQQKRFVDLIKPRGRFKFNKQLVIRIIIFMLLFRGFMYVLDYFNIHVPLWMGILSLFVIPILVNFVLRKFGLQRNDDITRFI